jgi:flagellar operon protein (TIGR03826 family)
MTELRNCRQCGKLYGNVGGSSICPKCHEAEEEVFRTVKEYVYDNPKATISQVSTELDVSVAKIKRYLREGRLEIVGDSNMFLECLSCGKAIKTGKVCSGCAHDIANSFEDTAIEIDKAIAKQNAEKKIDMRYLKDKKQGESKGGN